MKYVGACLTSSRNGILRLRYRWQGRQRSISLQVPDSPESRTAWAGVAAVVGQAVKAGRDPHPVLAAVLARASEPVPARPASGPTFGAYALAWLAQKTPMVRKSRAKILRHHINRYLVPAFGKQPVSEILPSEVSGLQAELMSRGLSTATVQKVVASFRLVMKAARRDGLVTQERFTSLFDLEWPQHAIPEEDAPDPFTLDEIARLQAWFDRATFRLQRNGYVPWPAYAAFVDLLAWTGMRPSEAAGLQVGDLDLANHRLFVRRSYTGWTYGAPKTRSARRTVELRAETATRLQGLLKLRVEPNQPLFLNTHGNPIEPQGFLEHFYAAQRATGIRVRGLYCLKDTFCSMVVSNPLVPTAWLEAQTGVNYATLKKHYAKWWKQPAAASMFDVIVPPGERARGTIAASGGQGRGIERPMEPAKGNQTAEHVTNSSLDTAPEGASPSPNCASEEQKCRRS